MKALKKVEKPTIRRSTLISQTLIDLLNYRIKREEESSRLYLAMSLWLNDSGYTGSAKLWKKYSDEELHHADWAREFLLAFGITPATPMLEEQPKVFAGLPDIIYKSYDHEVVIYEECKDLANAAFKENNLLLYPLGLKYTAEQVEELDKLQTHIDKLEAFGTDPIALRLLDNEFAST